MGRKVTKTPLKKKKDYDSVFWFKTEFHPKWADMPGTPWYGPIFDPIRNRELL